MGLDYKERMSTVGKKAKASPKNEKIIHRVRKEKTEPCRSWTRVNGRKRGFRKGANLTAKNLGGRRAVPHKGKNNQK